MTIPYPFTPDLESEVDTYNFEKKKCVLIISDVCCILLSKIETSGHPYLNVMLPYGSYVLMIIIIIIVIIIIIHIYIAPSIIKMITRACYIN